MQRERALRDRMELEHEHVEAEATEEVPVLVNRGLGKDVDSEDEEYNALPEFEVVTTSMPLNAPTSIPIVSQDDDVVDTPAANIRLRSQL